MTEARLTADRLNQNALQLCSFSDEDRTRLDISVLTVCGATILDFGTQHTGTSNAGILLARICLGGEDVRIESRPRDSKLSRIHVATSSPLASCIGAQYAGWPLSLEKYFAMCSGPIRMLRGKEPILVQYGLTRHDKYAVGVLESNQIPTDDVVRAIADECEIGADRLTLCVACTASLPGSIQVVARSVETALHKMHELDFDLKVIQSATGHAPLPPIPDDDLKAVGWTNDAILYGANVELIVDCADESIESIIRDVPSSSSPDFGIPFSEIFSRYDFDFYKIDKMLFSPAKISIHNRRTGNAFVAGEVRDDILMTSFEIQ